MKVLRVTMPNGDIYQIPAKVIAEDKARYYAKEHGASYTSIIHETMNDDYEIEDWASNNMNWDEVEKFAKLVSRIPVDFQKGWVNGEKSVVHVEGDE